ncbi:MAG: hypothetical protein JO227_04030 [Acetobacteraceae bacterium]|nr:hypothetical protein [Acetobacteraceae bacterium]
MRKIRRKDGEEHRYWSIFENRRVAGGRTVQRHVLYLGEINGLPPRRRGQAGELWDQLRLDEFWSARLSQSRQGTRWLNVLKTLVAYRLIVPG